MRQKLTQKFWPQSEKWQKYGWIFEDDIDYIINVKLESVLAEKEIISSKIWSYITRWKNYYYIVQKLNEKMFVKEEFEEILRTEFDSDNTSLINIEKLYKQVLNLKKKNKSKNYIRNKFVDRKLDEPIVDSVLAELFTEWEGENIHNELLKVLKMPILHTSDELKEVILTLNFAEKQKIMQKLVWKWFSFWDINDTLNWIEEL